MFLRLESSEKQRKVGAKYLIVVILPCHGFVSISIAGLCPVSSSISPASASASFCGEHPVKSLIRSGFECVNGFLCWRCFCLNCGRVKTESRSGLGLPVSFWKIEHPLDRRNYRSYRFLGIPSDEGQKPLSQEALAWGRSGVAHSRLYQDELSPLACVAGGCF